MEGTIRITTLFLNIGGVLLTNCWDHHVRRRTVTNFVLDWDEVEPQRNFNLDTYEEGEIAIQENLTRTVFSADRQFTSGQLWEVSDDPVATEPGMLDAVVRLKARHNLRIAAVNNESLCPAGFQGGLLEKDRSANPGLVTMSVVL